MCFYEVSVQTNEPKESKNSMPGNFAPCTAYKDGLFIALMSHAGNNQVSVSIEGYERS